MQSQLHFVLGGFQAFVGSLPDGLGPFWKGVKGAHLWEDERARARLFREAWILYCDKVDKWFDRTVCPKESLFIIVHGYGYSIDRLLIAFIGELIALFG